MDRRTFMFLLFVTALCKLPKSATAALPGDEYDLIP